MRKLLLLLLALVLVLGILLLRQQKQNSVGIAGSPSSPGNPAEARTNAMGITPPTTSLPPVTSNAATPIPSSTLNPPSSPAASVAGAPGETSPTLPALPPLAVLDNCRVVIHNYHDRFGENPVGDNAEISAALRGQNPRQVNFLRDDLGLRLNEKGELLDGYGTPFFFHQLSADRMEIRSAGQDRILFTFDDVVTR